MGVYLGTEKISVYTGGIISKPEEEKTVTAGTTPIEVVPSQGKLISKVNINPTPTEEKTVTPTTESQTYNPSEGKHFSQFIVNGDTNLISENIKNGINIFGITGNYEGSGQYAWKKTEKITTGGSGNITAKGTVNGSSVNTTININISHPTIPVSELSLSDLEGMTLTFDSNSPYNHPDYGLKIVADGSSYYLCSWDIVNNRGSISQTNSIALLYSNGILTKDTTKNNNMGINSGTYSVSGSKYINKQVTTTNFIDFVVSDNASKYPTSGQHTDGYYYSSISQ